MQSLGVGLGLIYTQTNKPNKQTKKKRMLLARAKSAVLIGEPAPTTYAKSTTEEVADPLLKTSYELYPYQRQGSFLLEKVYRDRERLNILCASPTGSGKSYLIKYCAKLAVEQKVKLRIAVPLVALAEQQYADLCDLFRETPTVDTLFTGNMEFEEDDFYCSPTLFEAVSTVGLWTGPTQENEQDALICVCTYEIVQIQLDKNPHWMDNCPFLVIDEVHSMNGDRGHVLEAMITHPQLRSNILALSGTIPNAKEFAENLGRVNHCPTYLVGAAKRPITLEYFLDIGYQFRKVGEGTSLNELEWKKANEDLYTENLPDRLSFNQLKTRLINLVYRLQKEDMLPAMCVAFSCRRLNQMAEAVQGIDFLHEKRSKWKVRMLFRRLEARIGKEDYQLVAHLAALAARGIVLHHSWMCKQYLETVSTMAKHNLAKLIFCTSTLSTGINLPVKCVVVTSSKMPSKKENGMVWLPSALFFQICGRAGRPGCGEKKGLVVLCQWENSMHWRDIFDASAEHVGGNGIVSPRTVMNCFLFSSIDTKKVLCESPFSSADYSHLLPLYKACQEHLTSYPPVYIQQAKYKMMFLDAATKCRQVLHKWARELSDGVEVLVDAPFPHMHPYQWHFKRWVERPYTFEVHESVEICDVAWVLDINRNIRGVMEVDTAMSLAEMRRYINLVMEGPVNTIEACYDMVETVGEMEKRFFTSHFGPKYQHILRRLTSLGYLENGKVPTTKGRLVSSLLATEDPVTLVECWYRHILPREDVHRFVSGLTCFLVDKKHDEPYNAFCAKVKMVSNEVDLCDEEPGSMYMGPMYQWSCGKNVATIVSTYGVNVGHFCKVVQRMCQLLQQMCMTSDEQLRGLCEDGIRRIKRGLPFRKSMFLSTN